MDKLRVIIGLIVIAIIVFVAFIIFGNIRNIPFLAPSKSVTIKGHTFSVTVANTDKEKEIGLSGQASLSQNEGMYFPFSTPSYYGFWMSNMNFPLDIIFIRDNKVVTVFRNLPPGKGDFLPVYKPNQPANAVLEINAGLSQKYNINPGDSVQTNGI